MQVRQGKIVYKYSGVQAIENYILARYHMYWQVYYHPTTRCYEQILISIFRRISDLYKQKKINCDLEYLLPFINHDVSIQDYLNLDEYICFYYFRKLSQHPDTILSDLCQRLLNRKLFVYEDYKSAKQKSLIETQCLKAGYDPRYYVFGDDQMQIPYLHYGNKDDIREIEIIKGHQLTSLPDVSEIVGAIIKAKENKTDSKIYYPETIDK